MMSDVFEEIVKIKNEGRKAALATIIATKGSTPREMGAKMLIREDGSISGTIGGGCLEAEVWQQAVEVMKTERPRSVHMDLSGREAEESGMICGGVMDLYIEPVIPSPVVYFFGGGHISLFVSKLSVMVGFKVVIIDDRQQFANKERFPEAEQVIAEEFPFVFEKLPVNRASYLVIVTRGHAYDQEVLQWALTTEAKYIGMIGSRKKIQTIYANLKEKGVGAERLKRVHTPIGLPIGALTPEEIAVSIIAEMIHVRRGNQGGRI